MAIKTKYVQRKGQLLNPQKFLAFINTYWLSLLVLIVCCVPFALIQLHGVSAVSTWFMPKSIGGFLQPNNLPSLWSPTFVHYTWLHLLPNLFLWWQYAPQLERENRRWFLALLIVAAASTNLLQWSFSGPKFGGLSGTIYFLFAMMSVVNYRSLKAHYKMDPIISIGLLLLIPLSATGLFGNFANAAHLGGLLFGGLTGFVITQLRKTT